MAKAYPDAVLDLPLDDVATSVNLTVCSAEPANFAGIAAVTLATVSVGPGDFAKGDLGGGGRFLDVAAKNGVAVTADGSATHLALDDGSTLKAVTTITAQALTNGNTVNIPQFQLRFPDPV